VGTSAREDWHWVSRSKVADARDSLPSSHSKTHRSWPQQAHLTES